MPQIPDNPYRILIIRGTGSRKTNSLFDLINPQQDIDKKNFYAKDSYQSKKDFLINKRESIGIKHFNDSKGFIEYSNDMDDCNGTRTHNHLVCKRTNNHLAKSVKRLSCAVSTYLYVAFHCMFLSCHVRISEWIHTL